MGLFSKPKAATAPPVRRSQVMKLIRLGMAQRDAEESPGWDRAIRQLNLATKSSTKAEIRAAHDALKRHGY